MSVRGAAETEKEYVLGTGRDELERLALQHRVWADAAVGAWKRAGIGPGSRVLDIGCGPGHAACDLAQLVTEAGAVLGVDESERFVEHVNAQARARTLPQLSAVRGDAERLGEALGSRPPFDAAYCRWALVWMKHPERAVEGVANALRPGGKFIVHDYFNWKSMATGPRSRAIEQLIAAALESFRESGGDIDIAARLMPMFRGAGLEVEHFEVHQRVARGGGRDSTLAWPVTWWRTYGPKLVAMGKVPQSVCDQANRDMAALERNEDGFYMCPPVFEVIGVRRD